MLACFLMYTLGLEVLAKLDGELGEAIFMYTGCASFYCSVELHITNIVIIFSHIFVLVHYQEECFICETFYSFIC